MIENNFGLLRLVMRDRKTPITEISKATGISRKTLSAWENNKVTRFDAPVIEALCKYFNANPGDLLKYIPDKALPSEVNSALKELGE